MVPRFLIGVSAALVLPLAPAQAVGPEVASVSVDGPLRAGAFSQIVRAAAAGLNASTMTAVIEKQSGPGDIASIDMRISSSSSVLGQLTTATAPGAYVLQLCISPKASPGCASALAVKAFTVVVAGAPASLSIDPAVQAAPSGVAATYRVAAYDAAGRATLLAGSESLSVGTSTSEGRATVEDVNTPGTGLNPRLRAAGIGYFTVANDAEGSVTDIEVTAVGFAADPVSAVLVTDLPPQDLHLLLDEPTRVTTLGATVQISGLVVDTAGDPVAGAEVHGDITGVDQGTTSTDMTGSDGRFVVLLSSTSTVSGQHDDVDLTAREAAHGQDSARAVVYFTANGRTPIVDVAIDTVPIADFAGSIDVPRTGFASVSRGSAALVSFTATVPGAVVDVSTTRGSLTAADDALWSAGTSSVSVTTDERGMGRVYLHSTARGDAQVRVAAARVARGVVRVVTPGAASRNVAMSVIRDRMYAGERALVTVAVTDAFGNPVAESRVDVALRQDSVGHLSGGGRQVTVRTDGDGTAEVEVVTGAREHGDVRLVARGDAPECGSLNQFACAVNEPGPGFAAADGVDALSISVRARSVRVLAPQLDAPVSSNEFIVVAASTQGIPRGTVALLKHARREVARAVVGPNGRVQFPGVRASGDGVYAIALAGIATRVQVTVRQFGIIRVRSGAQDAFTVATGAWRRGTVVSLLRDGHVVTNATVTRAHEALLITAAHRSGTYQVQVSTTLGIVRGLTPVVVR